MNRIVGWSVVDPVDRRVGDPEPDVAAVREALGDRFKAPVRPGDTITGEVKVTKVREDKPITELETRVVLADGTIVLNGTAVCYTMPIRTK